MSDENEKLIVEMKSCGDWTTYNDAFLLSFEILKTAFYFISQVEIVQKHYLNRNLS